MSNQSSPSTLEDPIESAGRAALGVLEDMLGSSGYAFVLIVSKDQSHESSVFANVSAEAVRDIAGTLDEMYDVKVDQ